MNSELELLEKIDRYLEGKLSSIEATKFEVEIDNTPQLASLVTRQKISNSLIIAERLNKVKIAMDQDFKSGAGKPNSRSFKWWFIGLVISGIIIGLYCFNGLSSETKVDKINSQKQFTETLVPNPRNEFNAMIEPIDNSLKDEKLNKGNFISKSESIPLSESSIVTYPEIEVQSENFDERIIKRSNEQHNEGESTFEKIKIEEKDSKDNLNAEDKNSKVDLDYIPLKNIDNRIINDYSLRREFGEVAEIPLKSGMEGEIIIKNRSGILIFQNKLSGERETYIWDGSNSHGEVSPEGLYIYILEYSNGEKEIGQILIY